MSSRSKNNSVVKGESGVSWKRVARLFVSYWVLAFMIVVLSFYAIAPLVTLKIAYILFAGTTVVAAIATLIHVRKGENSSIDEIAKKL